MPTAIPEGYMDLHSAAEIIQPLKRLGKTKSLCKDKGLEGRESYEHHE